MSGGEGGQESDARGDLGRILRLVGYGVGRHEFDEDSQELVLWVRAVGLESAYHECGGCGIRVREVHDFSERRVRDVPWGPWTIWLVIEVHPVRCRCCGVRTERFSFVEGKERYTTRFRTGVTRDCEDAAVSRVAAKWQLSISTVRRMDKKVLKARSEQRRRTPLRHMGVDEIFWKKGQFLTVVSDLERGEPIWAGADRKTSTLVTRVFPFGRATSHQ